MQSCVTEGCQAHNHIAFRVNAEGCAEGVGVRRDVGPTRDAGSDNAKPNVCSSTERHLNMSAETWCNGTFAVTPRSRVWVTLDVACLDRGTPEAHGGCNRWGACVLAHHEEG